MSVTIQESKILSALQKAVDVGLVEERFSVAGCEVVLRNLRPEEFTSIISECKDLEDAEYLYAFQLGHVCRALAEIDGLDLRTVDFVETEVVEGKGTASKTKTITLERHEWVKRKIFQTWGREALSTLYRKFVDVLNKAEAASVEGIVFVVPDEAAEDRLHRLLAELKATTEELPDDVSDRFLEEVGLTRKAKSDAEAAQGLEQKMASLASLSKPVQEVVVEPEVLVEAPVEALKVDPSELMRRRVPLTKGLEVQPPAREPLVRESPVVPVREVPSGRAAEIAALEAESLSLPGAAEIPARMNRDEIPELVGRTPKLDPSQVSAIIDQPPTAGINPRYRPPPRP
jgi:hypothetical protein